MLNNFIYAQTKDLFLEQLNAGNIIDEAIVFIEDTKEIWNHGTYFGGGSGSEIDSELLSEIQTAVAQLENNKLDKTNAESTYAKKTELPDISGYITKTTADGLYATIGATQSLQGEIDDLETVVAGKADSSALSGYATTGALAGVSNRVADIEGLIATDSDAVIDKWDEVVTFLDGISATNDLEGLLAAKANSQTVTDLETTVNTMKTKLDGITDSADAVSFSRNLTTGTKIGTITINGTGTDLYCQTNTNTWRGITDSVSITDSTISGSATAVKTAYDKAVSAYNLANGKTSNTGTVTSVAMTVPTGLSISGSPITTNGTLALSLASGYSIPTTAKQSNWDTAYGWGNHASEGYTKRKALINSMAGSTSISLTESQLAANDYLIYTNSTTASGLITLANPTSRIAGASVKLLINSSNVRLNCVAKAHSFSPSAGYFNRDINGTVTISSGYYEAIAMYAVGVSFWVIKAHLWE